MEFGAIVEYRKTWVVGWGGVQGVQCPAAAGEGLNLPTLYAEMPSTISGVGFMGFSLTCHRTWGGGRGGWQRADSDIGQKCHVGQFLCKKKTDKNAKKAPKCQKENFIFGKLVL